MLHVGNVVSYVVVTCRQSVNLEANQIDMPLCLNFEASLPRPSPPVSLHQLQLVHLTTEVVIPVDLIQAPSTQPIILCRLLDRTAGNQRPMVWFNRTFQLMLKSKR